MEKLVRDRIPEILAIKGEKACFYQADEQRYKQGLKEKLLEEVNEFLADESLEEIADIYEVLEAILQFKNYSQEELCKIRERKRSTNGAFIKRYIMRKNYAS